MKQEIIDFVKGRRVAVVGASRGGKKFGNTIASELQVRGYQVSLVHPEAQEIDGEPCYPNLAALGGQVDGVVICVQPTQVEGVLREAVEAGIKNIWIQQGAQSPEALAQARDLGVTPVTGKCILMYAEPVLGFHRWHKGFARLIGQY